MKGWIALLMALTLAGCESMGIRSTAEAPEPPSAGGPYYTQVRPDDTNLVAVADDGQNMYFEFDLMVPDAMAVFDADGKPLTYARHRNLIGITGLHPGVLLRIGQAASFVSVRPGVPRPPPARLEPSEELSSVRDQLAQNTPEHRAMMRAIARSEAPEGHGGTTPDARDGRPQTVPPRPAATSPPVRPRLLAPAGTSAQP